MNKIINILTHYLFIFIVLSYIFYEELVWERFAKPIVRYIQSLKILKKLEAFLQDVNGIIILVVFIFLFALTELQGFYAGALFFQGKVFLWAIIYAGKIPIAAFTFWLFRVTKSKLMAFSWFKRAFDTLMSGIDWLKSTDTYKAIKLKASDVKKYLKKNYLTSDNTKKEKFMKIHRRLKIRLREILKK